MQLWNTLTRQTETFAAGKVVRMYVCGITPYATTHLGHARVYIFFDTLVRELEHQGHSVRYVQNVTDVDDPLYQRARELGLPSDEIATECTRIFQDDMATLNARPPDFYPRASDTIPDMQQIIASLLDKGNAYQQDGYVYFRVRSFPRYGELSKLDREQMIVMAQEHGENPSDPRKEDPLDFILWKPSQPDEDVWPSPWGPGRPGWHIEDTTMALKYLGPHLDIHGGGADLIYPHHENELAQSESYTGQPPFARFWVHIGMLLLHGIKMSKSLGNLILVRDVLPLSGPMGLRRYLLSRHYRSPLDYSEDDLRASVERVEHLNRALRAPDRAVEAAALSAYKERFDIALADDMDTPAALEALDSAVQLTLAAPAGSSPSDTKATLAEMAARLGLDSHVILSAEYNSLR